MQANQWRPSWWREDVHESGWDRVKEAMRRDWEQTKKDLHVGGHEYNQDVGNTVRQAAGREAFPPNDGPSPARVIGDWNDVELPVGYGYGARHQYGDKHASWSTELDSVLRSEWEQNRGDRQSWDQVRDNVRRGYEAARPDKPQS